MNKKKLWTKGTKIERFDVVPIDKEGDFLNMLGQITFFKYYEDVFDPSVHVTIQCSDTFGFLNKLPIRSGAAVNIKLSHPSSEDGIEFDVKEEPLVITNIMNIMSDPKREIYDLVLETKHAVSNHTTRVWEKYKGNIANSVEKILKDKLKIKKDRIFTEKTKNDYEFVGNYRKPLKTVMDLCRKSIPEKSDGDSVTKGSSGFLFYETLDGFRFESIDTILLSEPFEEKYILTADRKELDPEKNNFKIVGEPNWDESHDIIKKLRVGAYKTANWYFDLVTKKPLFADFSYEESIKKHQKKANDEEVIPTDFTDFYSRIIVGVTDQGAMTPKEDGKETNTPQDQAQFQAQAHSRYSSLFSQTLDVTIPMNLSLRVGTMIELEFPELNNEESDKRNSASGKYMIAQLSHEVGNPTGDFTGLTLVRDSFLSKD